MSRALLTKGRPMICNCLIIFIFLNGWGGRKKGIVPRTRVKFATSPVIDDQKWITKSLAQSDDPVCTVAKPGLTTKKSFAMLLAGLTRNYLL